MPRSRARSAKTIGCKVAGPFACAIAPTAKGSLQDQVSFDPGAVYYRVRQEP